MAGGPSISRPPPANVPPVEIEGVRYEQVMTTEGIETDDHNGWLRAIRISDETELWTKQIYTSPPGDGELEGSGDRIFFEKMEASQDGKSLIIENENGDIYRVNAETGEAAKVN